MYLPPIHQVRIEGGGLRVLRDGTYQLKFGTTTLLDDGEFLSLGFYVNGMSLTGTTATSNNTGINILNPVIATLIASLTQEGYTIVRLRKNDLVTLWVGFLLVGTSPVIANAYLSVVQISD